MVTHMTDVKELLEQRGKQWGDASGTHVRIAKMWDAIADRQEITALKVVLMMDALKSIRADINPDEVDSFDDKAGYTQIARHIVGHPSTFDPQDPLPTTPGPLAQARSTFVKQAHAAAQEIFETEDHLASKLKEG